MSLGENAHRGLGRPARLAVDAAGYALGLALAGLSAARRAKVVHPHGVVFDAELSVPGRGAVLVGTELLGSPGCHRALVRFSRSLGLPRPLPDLLGMSVRVFDAYGPGRDQDFLMVTSVDAPVAHRLLVPATDAQQRPYSSSLPYRAGGRKLIVGALPRSESPRFGHGDELERVVRAAATGALAFDLAVAEPWGRFRPVAELRVGDRLPPDADAIRFDPWSSGGGIEPSGFLNRLRDYAYPLSRRAWSPEGLSARGGEGSA